MNIYTDNFLLTSNIRTILDILKMLFTRNYNVKNFDKMKTIIR